MPWDWRRRKTKDTIQGYMAIILCHFFLSFTFSFTVTNMLTTFLSLFFSCDHEVIYSPFPPSPPSILLYFCSFLSYRPSVSCHHHLSYHFSTFCFQKSAFYWKFPTIHNCKENNIHLAKPNGYFSVLISLKGYAEISILGFFFFFNSLSSIFTNCSRELTQHIPVSFDHLLECILLCLFYFIGDSELWSWFFASSSEYVLKLSYLVL